MAKKTQKKSNRAKPVTPKAGYTANKRRYCSGGKIKR